MQEHEQAITGHRQEVRIERVSWRDLRAVAAIQHASFRPGLAYGLGAVTFLRLMPGVTFLVARTDTRRVAGCVIADNHRGNTRIMNIAVHPEVRRQGVGRALLRRVEAELTHGDVVLMAEEWNTAAQALYLAEGFVRDGLARDYYGRGRHGVRMRKVRGKRITIRV